jgi:phosphatidylserine/phosphatidylglycerophosphate/cardiolipin synthase-like enzyme
MMGFSAAPAVGPIQAYLLSQCDIEVAPKPLDQQPHQDLLEAQAQQVAEAFASFVAGANSSLDICIYDFRLDFDTVRQAIVEAINAAADRGVSVRVAYDKAQESLDGPILKQFRSAGGDPAPVGTEHFLLVRANLSDAVATRAVSEEAIDPGGQIMHQKFMVRDGDADHAAIWTGSTNFTIDAWALQENNIFVVSDCPQLAAAYRKDFQDLWDNGAIAGTGSGDQGTATVASEAIGYAFAPGEGKEIETQIATLIESASRRLRVASMVTSSQTILAAIKGQIDAGCDFAGIYDLGETANVESVWSRTGQAEKLALLHAVTAAMVAKHSLPYAPQNAHNFMHNKLVVADDTALLGSFNFSKNATRNAENIVVIENADLANVYADYIDSLIERYR